MRIGLVARFPGLPIGLGTYAVNLLQALDRHEDEHEYFVYTPTWSEVPPLGPRFHVRTSPVPRGSRAALTLWDFQADAKLVPLDRIDPRMSTLDDWELLLTLHHREDTWDVSSRPTPVCSPKALSLRRSSFRRAQRPLGRSGVG